MAGASDKKQATSNARILKEIHLLAHAVNIVTLFVLFYFNRPSSKKLYFIFSLPSAASEIILEKIGRPKYQTNKQGYSVLKKAGEELKQSGLTEYMFDIIYLTLIIDVLLITTGSNKVWWLYLVVPGFAAFKLKTILGTLLQLVRGPNAPEETARDGPQTRSKSKRQEKMETRKQKQKVVYR